MIDLYALVTSELKSCRVTLCWTCKTKTYLSFFRSFWLLQHKFSVTNKQRISLTENFV